MHPYILKDLEIPLGFTTIGPFSIGTYGLMMAIGFLWGWRFCRRTAILRGWDPEFAYTIVINAMISGIVGARLFHVIDHWDFYQQYGYGKIFTASSGLTWYGGLILAIITSWFLCWRKGYSFSAGLDMVTPMLASGYAWGRIGCFFAGDGCYGIPVADSTWEFLGITFPGSDWETWGCTHHAALRASEGAVHPTMLYEAAFNFGLWGILLWVDHRWTVPSRWRWGLLFGIFAFFHSLERFLVEFIRINDRYWFEGFRIVKYNSQEYFDGTWGLSFSQWISIGGMLLGLVLIGLLIRGRSEPYPSLTGNAYLDQIKAAEQTQASRARGKVKRKKKR